MTIEEVEKQDREFLHNLATPITVAKTMIKNVHSKLAEKVEDPDIADQLKRMEKALSALTKIEELHADQKARIHSRK
jgi:mannitol/fructose-specific phosphotransferase system IIA component (Ntr-type)